MSRRNVKVEIPISSPDDMKKLVEAIQEKHDELGPASPLDSAKVSSMADDMILSADDRKEGNKLHAQAEAKVQQADIKLGTEEGQSVNTPGTVYNLVTKHVRDTLLLVHQGAEEQLSEYGFNVVISESGGGTGGGEEAPAPGE